MLSISVQISPQFEFGFASDWKFVVFVDIKFARKKSRQNAMPKKSILTSSRKSPKNPIYGIL